MNNIELMILLFIWGWLGIGAIFFILYIIKLIINAFRFK